MAVDLEWYLDKLQDVTQEEDVENACHRARVQWYLDLTVTRLQEMSRGGGEAIPIEERRELLARYFFTVEGRETWARSIAKPGVDQYNSLKSLIGTKTNPWHELIRIKRSLIGYDNFFSILTEPERFSPAVCALRAIARDLYDLYEMIDGAIPPGVPEANDPRKTAVDPGLCERPGDDSVTNSDVHLSAVIEEDEQGAG